MKFMFLGLSPADDHPPEPSDVPERGQRAGRAGVTALHSELHELSAHRRLDDEEPDTAQAA